MTSSTIYDTVLAAQKSATGKLTGGSLPLFVAIASILYCAVQYVRATRHDINVPAVGPSGRVSSYLGAIKFLTDGKAMILEGCEKYNSKPFKIPEFRRWHVIISDPEGIEEIRRAPDSKLSSLEALADILAVDWTFGPQLASNPYHMPVLRSQLTRNLAVVFDDLKDEIRHAFGTLIPAAENDWCPVPAYDTVMKIVCRTTNRVFVGLPLCRDPDFMELNRRFTIDVALGGPIIARAPNFLKPIVGEILTAVPRSTRRAIKHLKPIIEYRQKMYDEHGKDWPGKPNDMLSWLMDEATGEELTVKFLTQRILTLNFAAIHTSTMSFTQALYHLAARAEYIQPLRDEVEQVVKAEGWTKVAMTKMRKLDSFLKECQRFTGVNLLVMSRKAMVDYTLADGTHLPKGTFVSCNTYLVHHDAGNYPSADDFDGFRFANLRDEDVEEQTRHHMVSTSPTYLAFGHGKHACPGRFFAANELKAMMTHLLLNYDIKLEKDGVRPEDAHFASAIVPNTKAKVLFRKRPMTS